MDLVDYDEAVFDADRRRADRLGRSARHPGRHASSRSRRCTATTSSTARRRCRGTTAPPLLYHLEHVVIAPDRNLADVRFPVQWVIRPNERRAPRLPRLRRPGRRRRAAPGRRGASCCPAASAREIAAIDTFDGPLDAAFPTMSVTRAAGRRHRRLPRRHARRRRTIRRRAARELDAMVCWMSETPLRPGARLRDQAHDPHRSRAVVEELDYRVDVNTLDHEPADELALNEIGRVRLRSRLAADGRPLRAQPHHRQLHPDRRGDATTRWRREWC